MSDTFQYRKEIDLQKMLDERGVEWVDTGDGSTLIPAQTATNVAWDVNTWPSGKDMGDCLWVQNRHPLTPEQAIAAMLGSGTCKRILYKPTKVLVCSECGCGMPKQLDKYCYLHYCPNCGRKVDE